MTLGANYPKGGDVDIRYFRSKYCYTATYVEVVIIARSYGPALTCFFLSLISAPWRQRWNCLNWVIFSSPGPHDSEVIVTRSPTTSILQVFYMYTKDAKKMWRYLKNLFSRFQRLQRLVQHRIQVFFPSRSKFLPDPSAVSSESERTRRSAAPSPEVPVNEDSMSQKWDNRDLDRFSTCHERVLRADSK